MGKFWEVKQISVDSFYEMAETFDIILFKSTTTQASLIRTLSNSEWNHVGMCFKVKAEREVYILESTADNGVHFKKFSDTATFMGTHYSKVALRQLEFERTDEHMDKLNDFLTEAKTKQYNLGNAIWARKTVRVTDSMLEENRTFFCSELIAKAFKVCGIMEDID